MLALLSDHMAEVFGVIVLVLVVVVVICGKSSHTLDGGVLGHKRVCKGSHLAVAEMLIQYVATFQARRTYLALARLRCAGSDCRT